MASLLGIQNEIHAVCTEHQTPQAEIHSEPSNLLRTASPPPAWSSIHIVDI